MQSEIFLILRACELIGRRPKLLLQDDRASFDMRPSGASSG
jgi:hypothetical protein